MRPACVLQAGRILSESGSYAFAPGTFPIVFMDGTTGRLFREFSIVVSGSVIISSFAALTFTPMLGT